LRLEIFTILKMLSNLELTWAVDNADCVNWQKQNSTVIVVVSSRAVRGCAELCRIVPNCADYRHQSPTFTRIKLTIIIMQFACRWGLITQITLWERISKHSD
jgi:hypothetical protein